MYGAIMDIQQVLQFWFGVTVGPATPSQQAELWWSKQPEIDQQIRQKFADGLQALVRGEYSDWLQTASGRLAAIIVLDQFSRNIYRDTPQAFAQDSQALAWCLEGIDKQQDMQLEPVERLFFYLPLEHAEDMEMQDLSCRKFSDLLDHNINYQVTPSDGTYEGFYRFAERHRDVIQKFGRFPHRNKILGRTSSEQEEVYLNTPGSGF
jgi:uncharacterized protein (DUF924 family)